MALMQWFAKKTWKRETGALLVLLVCYVVIEAAKIDPIGTLKIVIVPFLAWAAAAFGLDWYSKQKPAI